jgi:glycosyltransferase involved in cell wall biosynthesis
MRFLLVNYEYPPIGAGAATATQAIAHNLIDLGHQVTVLTAKYGDLPKVRREAGVLVRRVRCFRRRADRCSLLEMASFVISALFSLVFVAAADRPNAGMAFFSIPCGPVALAAKALFGLPYVISLRGGDVPGLTPEVNRMHSFLRPLRRAVLKHAIAIVANAEGLRKLAETSDPFRVSVIPNGVDTEFFHPAAEPANASAHPFRILFTGRFQAQKNVSLLLDQCAALREHSAVPFELHLVGDGPLRTQLKEQADRLGLSERIVWHGWTPREQLRAIYQESHCFVNPSFYEGMPNAVLEAMACGKPIVASCVAGNDAVVRHGTTGFLFPLDEPTSLRQSLRTLIDDPIRAQEMGRSGRDWVERDFSWQRVAAAYAGLFDHEGNR